MPDIYQKYIREERCPQSLPSMYVKMKSVLKIMNQLLRAIPKKTAVHTINK